MECTMKQATKLFGVAVVAVSIGLMALPALAVDGRGFGRGGSGGVGRQFHGGGYYYGGYRGRGWGWGWGWGGWWYPWGVSYVYAPPPYYYYDGYYYNPPTAYYPPPA